jgi:hypothetical protein
MVSRFLYICPKKIRINLLSEQDVANIAPYFKKIYMYTLYAFRQCSVWSCLKHLDISGVVEHSVRRDSGCSFAILQNSRLSLRMCGCVGANEA